jgi:hypothetical protein
MTHQALKQAHYTYSHRDSFDQQGLADAIVSLAEWKLFSNRHISDITGAPMRQVSALTQKTDRTGGSFNPDALPAVIELSEARARGEKGEKALVAALEGGVSLSMLARLVDAPKSTLGRHAAERAA